MDETWQRSVLRKVAWRLLPFLFLLYVINILDRSNVAIAGLQMQPALQLSDEVFGLGTGIFYLGYILFEVPSNLIMRRLGARRWMARIMIGWGLVSCLTLAAVGPWSFCLFRILLGVAEAGFFPGIILYMTYWFPARERGRAVALFMAASPLTGALGAPISGWILKNMDRVGNLSGWQWLFLLEGTPAVILGLITLYFLTDRPEQAGWLSNPERDWLSVRMAQEEADTHRQHGLSLGAALVDGRVWLLILIYFTVAVGSNAFGFWAPKLMKSRFTEADSFIIGLAVALPNSCAVLCMIANAMHSDRTGERRLHVAVPAAVAALGLSIYVGFDSPLGTLAGLCLAQSGIMSMLPTFWTLPTSFLSGPAAAGGIALINSVGNIGGFTGPYAIGLLKEAGSGGFANPLLAVAATLCVGALHALCVRKTCPENRPV